LGSRRARALFAYAVLAAYVTAPLPWLLGSLSAWLLAPWLTLPLAVALTRTVASRSDGPSLNAALARTGLLQLVFCVLLSGGVLAS
jgi:1,4-dihydroxy-2-naphthoate octaprenyltransferase